MSGEVEFRVVAEPDRKVFYVDVGDMPKEQVQEYLVKIKEEFRLRESPPSWIEILGVAGSFGPLV